VTQGRRKVRASLRQAYWSLLRQGKKVRASPPVIRRADAAKQRMSCLTFGWVCDASRNPTSRRGPGINT
jgi:hypothetical protein